MSIMGLEPPLSQELIKSRYKELAKKYHPDLNKNDKGAEEQFKKVNMAYTVLKLAYERYSEISAD
jgi:curved DNA-binding protein